MKKKRPDIKEYKARVLSNLILAIDESGMSIKELATVYGCSQQYIYGLLKGKNRLGIYALAKFEQILGTSLLISPSELQAK